MCSGYAPFTLANLLLINFIKLLLETRHTKIKALAIVSPKYTWL